MDVTLRFWADGSPRLSAYEYQGLLASPCFTRGGLTCAGCHSAHSGNPRGMIEPAKRTAAACQPCHAEIVRDAAAHARHKPGPGTDCYACHMRRTVYGLLALLCRHHIDNPDPSCAWRHNLPEACTLCHVDRTVSWASAGMAQWPGAAPQAPGPEDAPFTVAESLRSLLSGDVLQRAVAAAALGAEPSSVADPVGHLWAVPFLLLALEDTCPGVRRIVWRSLVALVERAAAVDPAWNLPAGGGFDALGTPEERAAAITAWRAWWQTRDHSRVHHPAAFPLDERLEPRPEVVQDLRARQDSRPVSIGE